jgi:MSHA biogenesis protein MshN
MSLINQMLRDLDARHASDAASMPQQVRAPGGGSSGQRISRWLVAALLLLILGVVVTLGVGAWLPSTPKENAMASAAIPASSAEAELIAALPSLSEVQQPRPLGLRLDQTLSLSMASPLQPTASVTQKKALGEPPVPRQTTEKPAEAKREINPEVKPEVNPEINEIRQAAPAKIEKIDRADPLSERLRAAMQLYKQGRTSEAITRLQQALREAPQQSALRQALLGIYIEQRRLDDALVLLQEGLKLQPERADWAMAAARIQVERGRITDAWEMLQQHQTSAEKNADYQGFAAVLLQHLKKPHEAAQYYQAALRLKPQEARWWYALGSVLEADGQAAEAREAYQRAQIIGGLPASMAQALESKLNTK